MQKKITDNIKNNLALYKLALFMGVTGYGGMAIIQQIKREYVHRHKIVDEKKFLHALAFAQILPGSTIISLVSYFSYLKAGLIGATISTALYVLPTFVATTALSAIYFNFGNVPFIHEMIKNLNVLLVVLLIFTFIGIGRTIYFRDAKPDVRAMLITIIIGVIYYFSGLPMLAIVALSGILGVLFYYLTGFFRGQLTMNEVKRGKLFLRKKAWAILLLSILFFSAAVFYFSEPLWMLFSTFFKIGSLAFGGGVAAIPLMENGLVRDTGWFTAAQFWDGMAISQITPGPILISSAFFGYRIGGIPGAIISTIAICIPSFLLVILFGKIYERIKHLGIIRGIFRGFLSGFLGVLLVLVIQKFPGVIVSWGAGILFAVDAAVVFFAKKWLIPALAVTLIYSLANI
ncbi:MAG: chromate efflux transporter [Patescibacteria group bacterium]